ncbi:MAG: excinuclease ABC subunit UvrA [Candidatus Magasanikbacteria bacterium]|nr:excinuclease ABC subunit UvrA [Candidatus Magasanikbacteria bacterium]
MPESIKITNARVHNLKNISLEIPKNKFTVITGLSGSGKSSLAFDTIYAEGQRRYAESLNAYARQFMEVQDKPDVDEIQGLSPTIAIDQKNTSLNPRSTVGTATEIHDYLRLLFSRIGIQYCPDCDVEVKQYTAGEITELVRKIARKSDSVTVFSPFIVQRKVKTKQILPSIEQSGYKMVRINGFEMNLASLSKYRFDRDKLYDIDIITGKISDNKKQDLRSIVDKTIDLSNGSIGILDEVSGEEKIYSLLPKCSKCEKEFQPIEPRSFSFNSPYGACKRCTGLGKTLEVDPALAIPNQKLTLAEGAIQPWTRIVGNQNHYQKLLEAVAKENKFSINVPVKELSKKTMDIILYGTDGIEYKIDGKKHQFDGLIPNLTQRHAETDSDYVRKEIEHYMREKICPVCNGKRLKNESLNVKIGDYSIADIVEMSIEEADEFFREIKNTKSKIYKTLNKSELKVAEPIAKEVEKRLNNLLQVGLYYLTLDRSVNTLSGGESQRVRLSTQLSTGLTGVIYILDEPSIGLHPKDNDKLIKTLKSLRDLGNTVIVVEHDAAMIKAAEFVVDVGPGAGEYGGKIIAKGSPLQIQKNNKSITGKYLSGKEFIKAKKKTNKGNGKKISIIGAKAYNLKNIDVDIPLGMLVCVSGVSGSGKSTLINTILARSLSKQLYRSKAAPGEHEKIKGVSNIDKVISIDQTPIGRTPRSNPATYTGVFTAIRDLYTSVPEAKMRGLNAGAFSFNVKGGGRCEACSGEGYVRIPMQFLNDVFVECNECEGKRYNKEALEIHYRGKNIADVLEMTVEEAYRFFNDTAAIADKLRILNDVGLGYIHLGQPATTLSGGEAQRVKLATELSRRATGKTLYILDEPTTGLHFEDIKRLLQVINKLVKKGNTVLIIEHNLDIIKCADWVIDLGPDGGKLGGEIVAEGAPAKIIKTKKSYTGKYLKELLK